MYIKKKDIKISDNNKFIKKRLFYYLLEFIITFLLISFIMLHNPLFERYGSSRGGGMFFKPPFTLDQYYHYIPIVIILSLFTPIFVVVYNNIAFGKKYFYNNFTACICDKCGKLINYALENTNCPCGGTYLNSKYFDFYEDKNPFFNLKYKNICLKKLKLILSNDKVINNPYLKDIIHYLNNIGQLNKSQIIIFKNKDYYIIINKTIEDFKYYIEFYNSGKMYYESSKLYPFNKTVKLITYFYNDNKLFQEIDWKLIIYS